MNIENEPAFQQAKPIWEKPMIESLGNINEQTQSGGTFSDEEEGGSAKGN
jgi:hypothetical protein